MTQDYSRSFAEDVKFRALRWPPRLVNDVSFVAVINTSPDSYFKPSTADSVQAAVDMARKHISEGAHFIEVGGLSGGSSARRISAQEEIDRSAPYVDAIVREFPQVTVIIDTFRVEVAQEAFNLGATWVNDVTAATFDQEMPRFLTENKATVVIMHLEGPGGHKGRKLNRPHFSSGVVEGVFNFLDSRVRELEKAGLPRNQIIVDVGLGAGKRPFHDYELLASLDRFNSIGCRQMGASSRKQLVEAISPVPPPERLGGSIAAAMWSVMNGCSFLRVHEVRPYAQALDVWAAIASAIEDKVRD